VWSVQSPNPLAPGFAQASCQAALLYREGPYGQISLSAVLSKKAGVSQWPPWVLGSNLRPSSHLVIPSLH